MWVMDDLIIKWIKKENEDLTIRNIALDDAIYKLKEENDKLKEELEKTRELLNNVTRCSEQYREKMISIMEELRMFLYKD